MPFIESLLARFPGSRDSHNDRIKFRGAGQFDELPCECLFDRAFVWRVKCTRCQRRVEHALHVTACEEFHPLGLTPTWLGLTRAWLRRGLGLGGRLAWLACARRALGLRLRLALSHHSSLFVGFSVLLQISWCCTRIPSRNPLRDIGLQKARASGSPSAVPGPRPTLSAVAHSLRSDRASDGRQGPEPQAFRARRANFFGGEPQKKPA